MAQSHVAAAQDENSTPENYQDYNQSSEYVKPFQLGWTGMMIIAIVLAALVALFFCIKILRRGMP